MTLTREELLRARNGSTSTPVVDEAPERVCAVCGKPLNPRQQRACSPTCARRLGGAGAAVRHRTEASQRRDKAPGALDFLDSLPAFVTTVGIEHASWTVTAVRRG